MDKLPYYCHSFVLQASFKTLRTESKNSLTNHEIRQGVFLFSQGELEGDDKMKKPINIMFTGLVHCSLPISGERGL